MKKYLPLETCKRLVAMECTSQSDMYFLEGFGDEVYNIERDSVGGGCCNPSFEFEDFCGPSEHAIANAKKIFGIGLVGVDMIPRFHCMREMMMRSDWIKIIEAELGVNK